MGKQSTGVERAQAPNRLGIREVMAMAQLSAPQYTPSFAITR
jgi:hypothetical protein